MATWEVSVQKLLDVMENRPMGGTMSIDRTQTGDWIAGFMFNDRLETSRYAYGSTLSYALDHLIEKLELDE